MAWLEVEMYLGQLPAGTLKGVEVRGHGYVGDAALQERPVLGPEARRMQHAIRVAEDVLLCDGLVIVGGVIPPERPVGDVVDHPSHSSGTPDVVDRLQIERHVRYEDRELALGLVRYDYRQILGGRRMPTWRASSRFCFSALRGNACDASWMCGSGVVSAIIAENSPLIIGRWWYGMNVEVSLQV